MITLRKLLFIVVILALAALLEAASNSGAPLMANSRAATLKEGAAPASASRGQASEWEQIRIPTLPSFRPQEPRRLELPNGMVIFLQEDHELPLIRGTARIRGGSRNEPAAKVGLVEIYGEVWRTGGTTEKTGDELDDYLEALAARVETGGGGDWSTISWDCLKDNFDAVFKVFVDVLQHPEFREDKIPLAKGQINTAIARRNDQPSSIATRQAQKLGYGADSPYAREPEYATVAAVTRDDLVKWHQTYVHPNNIILGVAGDFDSKTVEAKLRSAFGSWPKGPAPVPLQLAFNGPKPGIYFVEKGDVNQSNIRMVGLGTRRDNPDYYSIEVFNQIFGGSFASRLIEAVRTRKGLAYAVGGGIGTNFDHPGLIQVSMGTKSTTTAASIQALYEEIDRLKSDPPTAEELKKAKDSILNSFVFRFDTREKVLTERMAYEFYGYPADFLERYRAGIEKITRQDVERVAEKYIHKDRLAVLVVGKAADFDKPLTSFGPVTTLNVSTPEPGTGKNAAPVASNPEGKALLAKIIEALGGQEKLHSVRAIQRKSSVLAKTPQGEMTLDVDAISVYPDQLWRKVQTPMGVMTMVATTSTAFMAAPQGTQEMPSSQKQEMLKELKRDPIFVAQHADDPKFTFAAAGKAKVGEADASILDVNADGAQVRWFVEPQTGRILRSASQSVGMNGPAEQVLDYSDWRDFAGIQLASKAKVTRDGQDAGSTEVKEVEINPTVDPKLFQKPQ
jgi:zinc protease